MHVYNAWLPPPVRELLEGDPDKNKFHDVVLEVERVWQLHTAESRFASLKWISVTNAFLKARSELAVEDLELLVKRGLDILVASSDNLFVQIQWSRCLRKILKKYRNRLCLTIEWKPFYRLIYDTHFKRRISYEGLALKQYHQDNIVSLVRASRRFFPPGSVAQIWDAFRPALDDLSHNSALEAVGFICLFLPTKLQTLTVTDQATLTRNWFEECLNMWAALPNSHYWDRQWASLLSRYIKHCFMSQAVVWDPSLPALYTHILRYFEVPVGKSGTSSPIGRDISREIVLAFSGGEWSVPVSKYYAKAIVYMLKPGSPAGTHLNSLIDLLEQYYHPSNGGTWTSSLERFLHYLVYYFQKRLAFEQRSRSVAGAEVNLFLGSAERISFVKTLLPLVERGQYSKDGYMSETAASTASMLTYVEPSLVLPLINSRFHTALNTITATHQLESAVTTLALAARPTFLACAKDGVFDKNEDSRASSLYLEEFTETLVVAMFSTLLGMDANDPPKTLATMALYSFILCNVGVVGDVADGGSLLLPIDWSQWLDEFLSRLFMLLVHLEPSGQQIDTGGYDDGYDLSSGTFLMQGGSFYHSVIELLFGRLTKPLYLQALKKLAQFVHNNILPGAASEIGLVCSIAVFINPAEAISQLVVPIMKALVAALGDFPSTGFGGGYDSKIGLSRVEATLSQTVETSMTFQLNILSASLAFAGVHILPYRALLDNVLLAAFNAPSSKVNEAGNRLLSSLLGSLIFYYPLDQYKLNSRMVDGVEAWISTKASEEDGDPPNWHISSEEELAYANALLDQHLRGAVACLREFCRNSRQVESSGGQSQGKEYLRVLFLRIDATLRGVGSCLPDFETSPEPGSSGSNAKRRLNVVGAFGATVGDVNQRQEAAEILHEACEYLFKERADDTVLLMMLIRVIDLLGNSATLEHFWSNDKMLRHDEAKCLTEPKMNFINNPDAKSKRRPRWWVVDMVSLHNAWRSSQSSFRPAYAGSGIVPVSKYLALLAKDLLRLSLHRYDIVRKFAVSALGKSLKRFPILVKDCLPVLTGSLEDPAAPEDSALGACKVLMLRPVLRHLTQDWNALSLFFRSLLKSAHHESVKAQTAINELFVVFSVRFGGLPSLSTASKKADADTYNGLVALIKRMLSGSAENIHWRYNLMANGMLLLLLVHPFSEESKPSPVLESRRIIAEQFLSNLSSELPALRPLSVIALLCLLQAWSPESLVAKSIEASKAKNEPGNLSLKNVLLPVIQKQGFGGTIVQNLAFDHHYPEGSGRSGRWNGSRVTARITDLDLTTLMPPFTRDWPRTRTWDSGLIGEAFSVNSAKLFKRLVRECGEGLLNALRGPLEEVANLPGERGKQCVAAEIIAGFLQSDVKCVVEAWSDWLRPLLQKCLMQATVESAPEWATCIRFSLTGKGGRGETSPVLQYEILQCLAEPLPSTASTSLIAKRLMLLRAALVEYRPVPSQSKEGLLHAHLLREITTSMAHPAPQVRENVGSLMCILIANIRASSALEGSQGVDPMETDSHRVTQPSTTVDLIKAAVGGPAVTVAKLSAAVNLNTAGPAVTVAKLPLQAGSSEPMEIVSSRNIVTFFSSGEALMKNKGSELRLVETATIDEFNKVLVEETKVSALRIQSLGGSAFGGSETSTSNDPDNLENGSQDVKWMETVLYFVIACLKSGKAVDMTTTLIGLLHPLLSLQETSEKDLSALARGALRLLNWHPIPSEHMPSTVKAVLGAAADTNWHTRVAALVFMQSFVYRHTYILSPKDKESLWNAVVELLSDPQVEVRELAATTIAGMMKGSDNAFAEAFREQTMREATSFLNASKRKRRTNETTGKPVSTASDVHGTVLGLAACILSVPYDMPTWLPDMVTLLGRFTGESSLIKVTVKKAISEFRRTHSDTWAYQKNSFSDEQLEVLSDLTSSASYFA